jgi:hypothetical protein
MRMGLCCSSRKLVASRIEVLAQIVAPLISAERRLMLLVIGTDFQMKLTLPPGWVVIEMTSKPEIGGRHVLGFPVGKLFFTGPSG